MTTDATTDRTPREVAELVRAMVAGRDGIVFADLFAADGVLEYPFAAPGMPTRIEGREQMRTYHGRASGARDLIDVEDVDLVVHETTDPEVVVAEITHRGYAKALDGPYEFTALGIMRVRDGQIVSYRDFMNPVAMAEMLGRKQDLVAALT